MFELGGGGVLGSGHSSHMFLFHKFVVQLKRIFSKLL